MVELYLVVTMLVGSSTPKVAAYKDIQQACVSYDAQNAFPGMTPHIYKETIDHRGDAAFTEGECQPLKQFVSMK
jgi:hypothetical protein